MPTVKIPRNKFRSAAYSVLFCLLAQTVSLCQIPRINTFFPIGGRAGSTVELEIRGSSLEGANELLVQGKGITGTVQPSGSKPDETNKPVWQAKCGSCHELRSTANRSMSPAQWAATVDRMVKVRQAPLSSAEQEKVTQYLSSAARSGLVTAQVKIAPNAMPGLYEMRIVGIRGASTASLFEVGNLPEYIGANNKIDQPMPIQLPCVVNGTLAGNGERHFVQFKAKAGQRLVFNLKGFRYNEASQQFFNPDLRLYNSTGKQLVENHGYFELDPLIDWNCPTDGAYTLEVRDLLGHGNPGSVYRLTMGQLPYDTLLYPPAAQAGANIQAMVTGKNAEAVTTSFEFQAPFLPGVTTVGSPYGPQSFCVSPFAVVLNEAKGSTPSALPSGFAGRISKMQEAHLYPIQGNGNYEIEGYATRFGSPLSLHTAVLRADGGVVGRTDGDNRFTVHLDAGKPYQLKVEGDANQAGPTDSYFIEARPARPELECVMRPSNVCLRPGGSAVLTVVLRRREGVDSDVRIEVRNLPPGVTASSAVIQPDRNEALVVLTAAPGTVPMVQSLSLAVYAQGPGGSVASWARAQDMYLLNNDPRYIDRRDEILTVRSVMDFLPNLATQGVIKVHPKHGTEVKVQIKRRDGFKGPVTVRIEGLPSGWVANPESIAPDKTEATLLVRPDGNDTRPFRKRDPKLTPITAVVEANADDFFYVAGTLKVAAEAYNEEEDKR